MTIKLYEVSEVAEICHVTEQTVRLWISQNKLKAIKPGRAYLIDEEDLRDFLKEKHG